MISFGSVSCVRIDRIRLPGDFQARVASQRVQDLALTIRECGGQPMHFPIVRHFDKRLVCGADRVAAMVVNGHKSIGIRWVDCDDDELEILAVSENAWRRHEEPVVLRVAYQMALTKWRNRQRATRENAIFQEPGKYRAPGQHREAIPGGGGAPRHDTSTPPSPPPVHR